MKYSSRIIEIANLITNREIADIGCDHGYLITYLLENDRIDFGIGADVNENPLLNAKKNISKLGFNDKTELYLSNGLNKLNPEQFESIVIAGMGGSLITSILKNDEDKLLGKEIIAQPNNNSKTLRTYMQSIGFKVDFETYICENDVIYELLKFVPGEQNWSPFELEFGKYNLENKTDLFIKSLSEKLDKLSYHYEMSKNKQNEIKLKEKIELLKLAISEN